MKGATRKTKLMVGGFVVAMVTLAIASVLVFGDSVTLFKRSSRFFASFKSTSGLHIGAPIKMGGVEIGSVGDIAIRTVGSTPEILLTLIVYSPNNLLIKADSEVSLESQGMLGDNFVDVTTGSSGAKVLLPGSFLKAKERVDLSAMVAQSTDIIKTVNDTTAKVELFVDSLPDAKVMKEIVDDFRTSSGEMRSLLTMLNAQGSILRTFGDRAAAVRLNAALNSLESAAGHFDSVITKIDSGQGTMGALVNDPAVYDDVRKLMGRANRSKAAKFIIQQVLENPDEKAIGR